MKKSDILETLINHYTDGNKKRFADMIGISPQLLSNWIKRDTLDYEQVYSGCKNLSGDFLLSGEGSIERNVSLDASLQTNNSQNVNQELLFLCRSLVDNYKQRDDVLGKLVSIVERI